MSRRSTGPLLALGGALLALALLSTPAHAQDDSKPRRFGNKDTSAQNAAFELRFGPYDPKIDDNTAAPVYSEFFGDGNRFMFGIEADWQAFRAPYIGTLGLGIGWGYTQMSASNLVLPGSAAAGAEVSQESTLNIMPFYGVGVLRVDTLARNFDVPLVPYGKFGLSWALWWINDGLGTATNDAGTTGRDISVGTQASVGLMFLLDVLEPSAAREADTATGVNNSYIFFEWSMSDYGGDQMNVGSNNWVTGLAFEI